MIKIKFWGTGPSNPITEKKGRSNRKNCCTSIIFNNIIYQIDIPIFFVFNKFDYLFLTHLHYDAFGGFNKIPHQKFKLVIPFELSKDIKYDKKILLYPHKSNIVEDIKVICFPVIHDVIYKFPTFGYQFLIDGKKITYTSDLIEIPKECEKYFDNIDLLITDGAGWKFNLVTHYGILPFINLVEKKNWKIKKIYFTHIGRPVPDYEVAQNELQKLNERYNIAYDGLELTI